MSLSRRIFPGSDDLALRRAGLLERDAWWLRVDSLVLFWVLPLAVIAVAIPSGTYEEVWGFSKRFRGGEFGLVLLVVFALVAGSLVAQAGHRRVSGGYVPHGVSAQKLQQWSTLLFYVTILGYVVWLLSAISNGLSFTALRELVSMESGASHSLRGYAQTIPGVTTLTQLGPVFVTFAMLAGQMSALERRTNAQRILIVVGLGLARSVINSERLAIFELLVPLAIFWVIGLYDSRVSAGTRRAVRSVPLISVGALLMVFAVSESLRSWVARRQEGEESFVSFIGYRILGYYSTSFNNSSLLLPGSPDRFSDVPRLTTGWLWDFPGLPSGYRYEDFSGVSWAEGWRDALENSANTELNTPGGVLAFVIDFGPALGLLLSFLAGFFAGRLLLRARRGDLAGLVAMPIIVITLLELPRIPYAGLGRAFPAMVIVVLLLLRSPTASSPRPSEVDVAGAQLFTRRPNAKPVPVRR